MTNNLRLHRDILLVTENIPFLGFPQCNSDPPVVITATDHTQQTAVQTSISNVNGNDFPNQHNPL